MLRGGRAVDLGLVEVLVDGRAQLAAAADAAAQQTSLEDVWAGRAPAQKLTRPCGLCGHFQPVTIPFLRRGCSHCSATWMPARCRSCATTVIAAVPESDALFQGTCTCGGELHGLAAIPRRQLPRTTADLAARAARARVAQRNRRVKVQLAGVVLAVLSGCGLVALLHAESAPAAAAAPATSGAVNHHSANPASSAGRGAAAGERIRATGGEINVFSCQAAYLEDLNAAALAARAATAPFTPATSTTTSGTTGGTTGGTTITPRASAPVAGTNPDIAGITPATAPTPAATDRAYLSACLTA